MFLAYRSGMMTIVRSMFYCFILLLLFTAFTAAGSYRDQVHAAPDAKILITGKEHPFGFLPVLLSVYVNQKIVFVNNAVPAAPYRVVAENHSFASPDIAYSQQWTLQIGTPGLYEYTDPSFKQQMVGELNVVPLSTKLLPPSDPRADATAIADLKTTQGNQASQQTVSPFFLAGILIVVIIIAGSILFLARRS